VNTVRYAHGAALVSELLQGREVSAFKFFLIFILRIAANAYIYMSA
jgi:hypothetical protein